MPAQECRCSTPRTDGSEVLNCPMHRPSPRTPPERDERRSTEEKRAAVLGQTTDYGERLDVIRASSRQIAEMFQRMKESEEEPS